MALHVTKCPGCESTFNTSAAMLGLAEGKVRCGACLTIFQAIDNFIEPLASEYPHEQDSVFVGNNPQDYFDPTKFLTRSTLQQEDEEIEGISEVTKEEIAEELEEAVHASLENDPIEEEDLQFSEEYTNEFFESIEQSIAESLKEAEKNVLLEQFQEREVSFFEEFLPPLISESEPIDPEPFPDSSDELVDPFEQAPEQNESQETAKHEERAKVRDPESDYPDPDTGHEIDSNDQFRELPEDFSAHTIAETQSPPQDAFPESIPEESGDELGTRDYFVAESITEIIPPQKDFAGEEDDTKKIRARALQAQLDDGETLESIPEESIAALDISSTPVELIAGEQRRYGRQIFLGITILLLGTVLGSQYLWQNMGVLNQNDRVRPLYEFVCTYTSCDLPDYSDISAIHSDSLTVTSHPELENGLTVNIEFRNTASFPQAFPVMVLSFNSASNEIVALREFAPDEYLNPVLRDISMMPSVSPVQVSLEIIDPGPGALNYTLAFRLP